MTNTTLLADAIITQDRAARQIGVSVRTLQAWRAQGYGPPPIRLGPRGGRVRYRASEVQAWIETQREQLPTPPEAA